MRKILTIISIILLLSSCGELYEDKYTFIPPKGKEERICANECVIERNHCLQQCMDKASLIDLGSRFISAFDGVYDGADKHTKECNTVCKESHSICHRNCGGQVIIEKVCIAHCKKRKE